MAARREAGPEEEVGGWSEELSEKNSREEARLAAWGAEVKRGLEAEKGGAILKEE